MAPKPRPLLDRLNARSRRNGNCVVWEGRIKANGYGTISVPGGKTKHVHRLAWELAHGPIPKGLCVCHHCNVRHCLNLDHLFLGTAAENMADMVKKGRHVPVSKLTAEEVAAIRRDSRTQQQIADQYGVSQPLISLIKGGSVWRASQ